jgi:hypothetical protein
MTTNGYAFGSKDVMDKIGKARRDVHVETLSLVLVLAESCKRLTLDIEEDIECHRICIPRNWTCGRNAGDIKVRLRAVPVIMKPLRVFSYEERMTAHALPQPLPPVVE